MDAAKSMGENIGTISSISRDMTTVTVRLSKKDTVLNNGDGFCFVDKDGNITGFRGDVCNGNSIRCKAVASLRTGITLFRNINAAFEKEVERNGCRREIAVETELSFDRTADGWTISISAQSKDGRKVTRELRTESEDARNKERMEEVIRGQISKTAGIYSFIVKSVYAPDGYPFMTAALLNGIRRELAEGLDKMQCHKKDILHRTVGKTPYPTVPQKDVTYKTNISNNLSSELYKTSGAANICKAYELSPVADAELMRSRYCIRYELGICPVHHHVKDSGPLYLLNNGRRLALHFDCRNCEMTVTLP